MTEPVPTIEEIEPAISRAPVARAVEPRGGRFGLRWAIALVVVALLVATSVAGAWLLAGNASTSSLAGWVPSDSVVYIEGRLDLPGDQRQQLGNVLAHFPGFRDQSILDEKIAESFDQAIRAGTTGGHDYSTEIRPWFGGEIAASVASLPEPTSDGSAGAPRGLLLATTKDPTATAAWIHELASDASVSLTDQTYGGATIRVATQGSERSGVAIVDGVLIAGDLDSVKAAIDTHGSAGLAANADFATAMDGLDGDHLGALFVNMRAYLDWAVGLASSMGGGSSMPDELLRLTPAWVAADVRASNGDAISSRFAAPHVAAMPVVASGASALVGHIPANALLVLDAHDYGTIAHTMLDVWRSSPSMAESMKMIDTGLGVLGGEDAALDWIGEVALVVTPEGDAAAGGLLASP
jgi:hypothetical protein